MKLAATGRLAEVKEGRGQQTVDSRRVENLKSRKENSQSRIESSVLSSAGVGKARLGDGVVCFKSERKGRGVSTSEMSNERRKGDLKATNSWG